jgi:lysozyme family protein
MEIVPRLQGRVDRAVARCITGKARYESVVAGTSIPWVFPAVIHEREASCNFDRQLSNGQRWNRQTTLVPKGIGPWNSWEDSITNQHIGDNGAGATTRFLGWIYRNGYDRITEWSIPQILYLAERLNGWGYKKRGLISPYVWRCAECCVGVGKYVADGKFDPNAGPKDRQVGVAPLLDGIIKAGDWAPGDVPGLPHKDFDGPLIPYRPKFRDAYIELYQEFLNSALFDVYPSLYPIKVDGFAGPKTSAAHKAIFGRYLVGDPREAQDTPDTPNVPSATELNSLAAHLHQSATQVRKAGEGLERLSHGLGV